jgi:hypothetical protein
VLGLGGHRRRYLAGWAVVLGLTAAAPASSLATVVTVGTPTAAFGTTMSLSSCSSCTQYQLAAPGYTLAVPAAGHITAWRVAGRGPLALAVLRPSGSALSVVATSPAPSFAGTGTFPVDVPVAAGDQIGVDLFPTPGPVAQLHFAYLAGASFAQATPAVATGGPVSAASTSTGAISLNADVALTPVAAAIDVKSGPVAGGTAVAITGAYLDGATSVTFGGQSVPFALDPSGRLLTRTPPWPAPGQVDVAVHGPGGTTTLLGAFTYVPNPGPTTTSGGGVAPSTGPVTAGGAPGPRPVLTGLSIAPAAFLPAASGASLAATATGARLTYTDSVAATTSFAVARLVAGRLVPGLGGVGQYCQPAHRPVPAAVRCMRHVALAPGFSHRDRAGTNVLRFTGRLGGRALAPGSYRLSAVASGAGGTRSVPVLRSFRILAPPHR